MLLHEIRTLKKLSQAQLADLADTQQCTISFLERGKTYPSAKIKSNIEKALGNYVVDWIGTRLQGDLSVNFSENNETAKDRLTRAVFSFLKTAIDPEERQERIKYLQQILTNLNNGGKLK